MKTLFRHAICLIVPIIAFISSGCHREPAKLVVERPERIVSKRNVSYDSTTYVKLARLWENYFQAYPSEDAYANWMYAARYANLPDYESLLKKGLDEYPANPILLYLGGLRKHGGIQNVEGRQLLERAASLDPGYLDPWFALVVEYMAQGDRENADIALRHLLEGRAVEDGVMDYSFNMLACLDANAILITNGDNDTYPGWILTRILKLRRGVNIVNRALLSSEWYPMWIMNEGVPTFISKVDLESLRNNIFEEIKAKKIPMPQGGMYGDTLIVRVIDAANRSGRPVYFSATMDVTPMVERYRSQGRNFGLVTLVHPSATPYSAQLRRLFRVWTNDFRYGGLDSWQLRYSPKASASRFLAMNYVSALYTLADRIASETPEYRVPLFRWFQNHLISLIPQDSLNTASRMWCRKDSPKEIRDWCKEQGFSE